MSNNGFISVRAKRNLKKNLNPTDKIGEYPSKLKTHLI